MEKISQSEFDKLGVQNQIKYLKQVYEIMTLKLNFIISVTSFIAVAIATAVFKYLLK